MSIYLYLIVHYKLIGRGSPLNRSSDYISLNVHPKTVGKISRLKMAYDITLKICLKILALTLEGVIYHEEKFRNHFLSSSF